MKIETFCRKTGWPVDEFMSLGIVEACEILALFGLQLAYVPCAGYVARERE